MMRRPIKLAIAAAVFLTTGVVPASGQQPAGAEQPVVVEQRVYETGPLSARDFQAKIPADNRGLDAWTTTDLVYRLEYQTRITSRIASVWTTQVTVEAVVIPGKSWNRRPDDSALMDHEQGHFDLSQIAALRARIHFANQRLTGTATTAEAAARNLDNEVQRQIREFFEALRLEHEDYDRLTRHGRDESKQREQRRLQQEELAKLTEQWRQLQAHQTSRSKSRPARRAPNP
ncbi:MAG: hypothetical protein KJ000_04725 [Pirellulaceae bacterium]|nr:hypothetical protein [Pirellulaceae bacterium]